MATLITSIGTSAFDSTGERRLAKRLQQKLHADYLARAHKENSAWGDMAVLCANTKSRDLCARTLAQRKLPIENWLGSGDFNPTSNEIKVMTMKVSTRPEYSLMALPDVGICLWLGDEKEATQVFYVLAARATQQLAIVIGGSS